MTDNAGKLVPIAFHAWDRHNGEVGLQRSISSWYFLLIEVKTPPGVYVAAFAVTFATVGLEFYPVRGARNRTGNSR